MRGETAYSPYAVTKRPWFWPAVVLLLAAFNCLTAFTTGGLWIFLSFAATGGQWVIRHIGHRARLHGSGAHHGGAILAEGWAAIGMFSGWCALTLALMLIAAILYVRASRAGRGSVASAGKAKLAVRLSDLAYVCAAVSGMEIFLCFGLFYIFLLSNSPFFGLSLDFLIFVAWVPVSPPLEVWIAACAAAFLAVAFLAMAVAGRRIMHRLAHGRAADTAHADADRGGTDAPPPPGA